MKKLTEEQLNDTAFTLSVIAMGISFLSFIISLFG